jgi:hypothetical protein
VPAGIPTGFGPTNRGTKALLLKGEAAASARSRTCPGVHGSMRKDYLHGRAEAMVLSKAGWVLGLVALFSFPRVSAFAHAPAALAAWGSPAATSIRGTRQLVLRGGANPTRPWRDFGLDDGEAGYWYKPPAGARKAGVAMGAGATDTEASSGDTATLLDHEFPDPRFFAEGLAEADPEVCRLPAGESSAPARLRFRRTERHPLPPRG